MIPTAIREIYGPREFPREPEPQVMDGEMQVAAFEAAGRVAGVAAAHIFHTARISQVIQGCREVLDLGCGPAVQMLKVAALNPDISFRGVDLSSAMLGRARDNAAALGLANTDFTVSDITTLEGFADRSVDGVITTMALHHLPTLDHLRRCFRQIKRVLRPEGAIYLIDFGRLKSLKSALYFAYMDREALTKAESEELAHAFCLDYERSLRAAFLPEEFQRLAQEELPSHAQLHSTYRIPFLTVIKSADKPLPDSLRKELHEMRAGLERRYRRDLDDIRNFFRWGGLENDPFALRA